MAFEKQTIFSEC